MEMRWRSRSATSSQKTYVLTVLQSCNFSSVRLLFLRCVWLPLCAGVYLSVCPNPMNRAKTTRHLKTLHKLQFSGAAQFYSVQQIICVWRLHACELQIERCFLHGVIHVCVYSPTLVHPITHYVCNKNQTVATERKQRERERARREKMKIKWRKQQQQQ